MEMAVLKSNLCPTCGGLLDIDIEKQMYVCAFCGVSFDYEYFREDNVKEVAYKALLRNEYGSAKDAYDFVLAKDPHDFDALRGLFLCKVKWTDMKQMFNDSEVKVTANEPALNDAIEKCLPEHKPYFEKIREALNELRHYRDLKTEAKVINEKRDKTKKVLNVYQDDLYTSTHLFTEFCDGIKEMGIKAIEAAITIAVVVPLALIGSAIWKQEWGLLIAFAVIAAVLICGYHLIKFIAAKCIARSMAPHQKKLDDLTGQYEAKNAEAAQSKQRYRKLVQELIDMDPVKGKKK